MRGLESTAVYLALAIDTSLCLFVLDPSLVQRDHGEGCCLLASDTGTLVSFESG